MRLKRYVIPTALVGACAAVVVSACREDTAFDSEKVASLAAKAKKVEGKTPYGQPPDGYVLSFAEEFDSFDPQLWNDHAWYEQPNPTRNYAVEDGKLKIWPQRDAHGKFFNRTLDTDGKFKQKYGYFEMEARLVRGKGAWPAFWLFAHPGDSTPQGKGNSFAVNYVRAWRFKTPRLE